MKTVIHLIIYDRQGPLGNTIARSVRNPTLLVFKTKRMSHILELARLKRKTGFVFVLFVFHEEHELVECTKLNKLNAPIIFAPTNRYSYQRLRKMEGIEVMDVTLESHLFVTQIMDFLKASYT
ncbi:MAG: hypothetical protein AAGA86_02135 [Bacteroidota bacterium]